MSGDFLAGFIVALSGAAVAFLVYYKIRLAKSRTAAAENTTEFEELGKLTGQLAHEIKNPLSTIKVNLKLIGEELEELDKTGGSSGGKTEANSQILKRSLRKIAVVQKETDRLDQILEGFLRYVDKGELEFARVDVNELVSDIIDFYLPQASSHNIMIRQGLSAEPLWCMVDADMLKQVLLNLFINAQEAMEHGGELIVRTDRQKERAVIDVTDTGSGIAAEKIEHIFEPYYSSKPGARGLGLPTAKKIVHRHNGEMAVSSLDGKGTSFLIKLPLVQ